MLPGKRKNEMGKTPSSIWEMMIEIDSGSRVYQRGYIDPNYKSA